MVKGIVYRHITTLDNDEYSINEKGECQLGLRYLDMAN